MIKVQEGNITITEMAGGAVSITASCAGSITIEPENEFADLEKALASFRNAVRKAMLEATGFKP